MPRRTKPASYSSSVRMTRAPTAGPSWTGRSDAVQWRPTSRSSSWAGRGAAIAELWALERHDRYLVMFDQRRGHAGRHRHRTSSGQCRALLHAYRDPRGSPTSSAMLGCRWVALHQFPRRCSTGHMARSAAPGTTPRPTRGSVGNFVGRGVQVCRRRRRRSSADQRRPYAVTGHEGGQAGLKEVADVAAADQGRRAAKGGQVPHGAPFTSNRDARRAATWFAENGSSRQLRLQRLLRPFDAGCRPSASQMKRPVAAMASRRVLVPVVSR